MFGSIDPLRTTLACHPAKAGSSAMMAKLNRTPKYNREAVAARNTAQPSAEKRAPRNLPVDCRVTGSLLSGLV
jgi:hypothetical protein